MSPKIEEAKNLNVKAELDEPEKIETKKKCKPLHMQTLMLIALIVLVVGLVPDMRHPVVTYFSRIQ